MTQEASGKRRYPRYDVEGVHGSVLYSMDADVIDLGLSGMAVESHTWLSIRHRYSVRLARGQRILAVPGTVVWCNLVRTAKTPQGEVLPVYRAGIEFAGVLSDRGQELLRMITQENAVVQLENRIFGRFKAGIPGTVNLGSRYDFDVCRISLSGMLIETELAPDLDATFPMEILLGTRTCDTRGRIANVRPTGEEGGRSRHRVGVEFLEMGDGGRQALEVFLQERAAQATTH